MRPPPPPFFLKVVTDSEELITYVFSSFPICKMNAKPLLLVGLLSWCLYTCNASIREVEGGEESWGMFCMLGIYISLIG